MNEQPEIGWGMTGSEVEQESFRRIEEEAGAHGFGPQEWPVVRRMVHACADFSIMADMQFRHDPVAAIHRAVRAGAPIYSDSNMIRSGVSVARLSAIHPGYTRESIHCYIADPDVAAAAKAGGTTRALAALEKGRAILDGAIVLIGNAPLALAGICRMVKEEQIRPAVVIGMPVGFVHVVESKQLLGELDIPQIVLKGRRGGSPLAVAALHGALESIERR